MKDLMKEDVRLQRSHEQQRGGARIANVQHAGGLRAPEVLGHDLQTAARGRVGIARIERQHDGRLRARKHVHGEVFGERRLNEGHELLRQTPEHDPRVGRRVHSGQLEDEGRNGDALGPHRRGEQGLLAREVPQDGRGRDVELGRDVRERGGFESLVREHASCGIEQRFAADDGRPSHL